MPRECQQDVRPEADGVLVRPIGGQIYLVEEPEVTPDADDPPPDGTALSGLISRH